MDDMEMDLEVGDESDADWTEALRIASSLLGDRIRFGAGDRDAIASGYGDLLAWAGEDSPEVAIKRLLSVIEALVRYGEGGLTVTAEAANDPTLFEAGPLGPGTTAADVLDHFRLVVERVEGEWFTIG